MNSYGANGLDEVRLIDVDQYTDDRGYFMEVWNACRYADHGIPIAFMQDNESLSKRNVLRGLHYQLPSPQGKLVRVVHGSVLDVAVDIRWGSPTFGVWTAVELSSQNRHQLWIPPGFAHGFVVTSDEALFCYKCTTAYNPTGQRTIRWNDPRINIQWPIADPVLSDQDASASLLDSLAPEELPLYQAAPCCFGQSA
jgi:dTDP-4-dehydrorhamnose 3,5-epimerase